MENTKDVTEEAKDLSIEDVTKSEYRKAKARYEDYQNIRKKGVHIWMGFFSSVLFSFIFILIFVDTYNYEIMPSIIVYSVLGGCTIGILLAFYIYMLMELKESQLRRRLLEFEAVNVQDEVREDIFENSIKMSYKYLDQYYLQTREQAQRGFLVTVCVAIFGAILIGAGIIAMFLEKTNPAYATCASGVITEFISAIFFYLYNRTISSMSKYHNKLVISQNISIALKVADSLPSDDKTKAKNEIIKELLKDVNSHLVKSDSDEKKVKNKKDN